MPPHIKAPGLQLQSDPLIYVTVLPGNWLIHHSTPSWRIKDPKKGFQRVVKEERAQKIAIAVLDQQRTFPNAIVLATDSTKFNQADDVLHIPNNVLFLVVDGQHRLWAQKYSSFEAKYACVIHMGLTEVQMAQLFLEINDNQKRVPSSLRWDLVHLVRPDDDPYAIAAADLVLELNSNRESPLYQRIDLTGEQPEISLKQGSIAPEIKTLVSMKLPGLKKLTLDMQYEVLLRYLAAIRSSDLDGWKNGNSPFYKARVLRVLLKLLPLVIKKAGREPEDIHAALYKKYTDRVDKESLSDDAIKAIQGSAGMKEIYMIIKHQMHV